MSLYFRKVGGDAAAACVATSIGGSRRTTLEQQPLRPARPMWRGLMGLARTSVSLARVIVADKSALQVVRAGDEH
ncbi:hypothetical protein N7509_000902 [Penicillium cosmopolitanum]|uniref:Uncharacterized protein n=1 Tax=Penicillium cosmopolitanum TaxID=1131564 RepID=A0A9X0BEL4_9EURO|nr:uncharacterized protein N7509_000902 [Penicillium cosmopolitanum]KAJ5414275.1 hypothetical protein N7509_000902 [Penicillium cosmopolitanum]